MPRRAPFDPTGHYHVSTRGNFGEPLFRNDGEHELYLELYEKYAAKFGWETLDWCLMWNHHHFLVKLAGDGLSEGMRAINHGFARRMNAVYGRTGKGHLVRHSFFANRITTDGYRRSVLRYIARNPIEAGLCDTAADWRWSGYSAIAGLASPRPFHNVDAALRVFGDDPQRARAKYARFVHDPFPGNGYENATELAAVVESLA
ncbi:MAG TPA: transposase [Gaiellaceae bacterium]